MLASVAGKLVVALSQESNFVLVLFSKMRSSCTLLALAAGLACAAAQQSLAWIGQTFDGATVTFWTLDATGAPTSKRWQASSARCSAKSKSPTKRSACASA